MKGLFLRFLNLFMPRVTVRPEIGFAELLLYGWRFTVWQRYSLALRHLLGVEMKRPMSILDVGASGIGIAAYLDCARFEVYVTDLKATELKSVVRSNFYRLDARGHNALTLIERLVADANSLPFRDGAFDAVTAVAMLEHIPRTQRSRTAEELMRVLVLGFHRSHEDI